MYAGSAPYYAQGRFPYPSAVADALGEHLGLDGYGRLLDVGCGPGSLTLVLARLFAQAVGIDPDVDMLEHAHAASERVAVGNVHWVRMRAEDLPGDLGRFHVVTFAQSFHWVDRPLVAGRVRRMLEPGGACVLVQATTHLGLPGRDSLEHPRPPREEIAELVTRYLGPVRRAGHRSLPDGPPSGEDEIMRAVGFVGPTRLEAGGGSVIDRSEDDVVASVFSLSSAAPHLLGDRRGDFENDLRDVLRTVSANCEFSERTRDVALDVWWPRP